MQALALKRNNCVVLLLAVALGAGCNGQSLETDVAPASASSVASGELSWWSRAAIDAYLRYSVWSGTRSGFVALFARDGVPVYATTAGWKDIESAQPMRLDTPVRLTSMTKPVTAVAAMILVEEGWLDLDDPVAKYIPAFATPRVVTSETPDSNGNFATRPAASPILVRHLLMFSSGIGAGIGEQSALVDYWQKHGMDELEEGSLAQRVEHGQRLCHQRCQRHGLQLDTQLAAFQAGQVEHVVDQRQQVAAGSVDVLHLVAPRRRARVARVGFGQQQL